MSPASHPGPTKSCNKKLHDDQKTYMMIRMVRRSIDKRSEEHRYSEVSIMNGHSPDVDQDVHNQIRKLVHWEEKHVDMIGTTL